MIRRLIIAIVFCASAAMARPAPGPQQYLIFRLREQPSAPPFLLGTLSADTDFEFSGHSRDSLDFVAMRATLRAKTSQGFRFSWTVVQRLRGSEVAHIATEELVLWGSKRSLKSIPRYSVDVFYSRVPANEIKQYWPNHARERTADPLYTSLLR
jgi:hypothetical protein